MVKTMDAIRTARSLIGTPYSEIDCIGLIVRVIRTAPGGGGAGPQGNDPSGEHSGGAGGSGIVCIRNSANDVLPVIFNGTQLTQLIYNGTTIQHLIYNGQQLY